MFASRPVCCERKLETAAKTHLDIDLPQTRIIDIGHEHLRGDIVAFRIVSRRCHPAMSLLERLHNLIDTLLLSSAIISIKSTMLCVVPRDDFVRLFVNETAAFA